MLLRVTPEDERDAVERVVVRFSDVVRGWLWANVFVGAIQATSILLFLSLLDTPAALVWAVLGFFSVKPEVEQGTRHRPATRRRGPATRLPFAARRPS